MMSTTGVDTVSFSQQLVGIYGAYSPRRYQEERHYSESDGDFTLNLSPEGRQQQALAFAARHYDVRNLSNDEMRSMSEELFGEGALTLPEHALLSVRNDLHSEANRALRALDANDLMDGNEHDVLQFWQSQIVQAEQGAKQVSNEALFAIRKLTTTLRKIDAMRNQ